jgi:hypothetical protein
MICALDVLPMPGGPLISTAFFFMSAACALALLQAGAHVQESQHQIRPGLNV